MSLSQESESPDGVNDAESGLLRCRRTQGALQTANNLPTRHKSDPWRPRPSGNDRSLNTNWRRNSDIGVHPPTQTIEPSGHCRPLPMSSLPSISQSCTSSQSGEGFHTNFAGCQSSPNVKAEVKACWEDSNWRATQASLPPLTSDPIPGRAYESGDIAWLPTWIPEFEPAQCTLHGSSESHLLDAEGYNHPMLILAQHAETSEDGVIAHSYIVLQLRSFKKIRPETYLANRAFTPDLQKTIPIRFPESKLGNIQQLDLASGHLTRQTYVQRRCVFRVPSILFEGPYNQGQSSKIVATLTRGSLDRLLESLGRPWNPAGYNGTRLETSTGGKNPSKQELAAQGVEEENICLNED